MSNPYYADAQVTLYHGDCLEILAEQRAERERQLAADRKRITLFALESVAGDGLPRVSGYTVDTLADNMLERQVDWPLPNVWLGVSSENQKWADIRVPALLDTPATVRFISAEPLLGPIDLARYLTGDCPRCGDDITEPPCGVTHANMACDPTAAGLDWVIVGGESGPGARPMHPDWARSLRDQCQTAGVPFLFKQWGEYVESTEPVPSDRWLTGEGITHDEPWRPDQIGAQAGKWSPYPDVVMRRVGKKAAGRELDGRTWDQYPDTTAAVPA